MALSRRNQNQLAQLTSSGNTAAIVQMLGKAAGDAVRSYLKGRQQQNSGSSKAGGSDSTNITTVKSSSRARTRRRGGGDPSRPSGAVITIPGNFFSARKRMTIRSREMLTPSDTTGGNFTGAIYLGLTTETAPTKNLLGQPTRIGFAMHNIINVHQYGAINRVRVRVKNVVPSTSGGFFAIGYLPGNTTTVITSLADFNINTVAGVIVGPKENATFTVVPMSEHGDNRVMIANANAAASTFSVDAVELYVGQLVWYGNMDGAIGGSTPKACVLLDIEADIEIWSKQ